MQKQLLAGLEVYILLYIFLLVLFGETVQSKNTFCNIKNKYLQWTQYTAY